MWDERVPIHVASKFYDVAGFKAGRPQVQPFEVDELGALGGLRLAHLQCHFGLDTLDLVRAHPDLEAVGLDFSEPAIEAARTLAKEVGLSERASFVQAEVRLAAQTLGASSFDVIYAGKGALCWLPDLRVWAEQCAQLLKPGGWLYLCEFHPVGSCLDTEVPGVKYDYFDPNPFLDENSRSYADPDAVITHNRSYLWQHPLDRLFEALLGVGFELRFFHEWDYTIFKLADWLVEDENGRYHWPASARLPLMFSLKAEKRAG
jgi:SAM-dependent methyltransferase